MREEEITRRLPPPQPGIREVKEIDVHLCATTLLILIPDSRTAANAAVGVQIMDHMHT